MSDRIRVGVAGLGTVAQAVHLPLLARRWDLFEVAAVCDRVGPLRDQIGEAYGVPPAHRYHDVAELLASAELDGVLLLTSGSHASAAGQALQQGTPVFCEKPLAYTVAEADQLLANRADRPRRLLLGYMKERDPAVRWLRERLADLPEIRAVEIRVLHPTGESQLAFANLRTARPPATGRRPEASLLETALGAGTPDWFQSLYERVVLSSLIHDTSLLRSLFGGLAEVDDVRVWPEQAAAQSIEVAGALPGGARARLSWHYLPDYPVYRETLSVHHRRGSLTLHFGTPYLLNAPTELVVEEAGAGPGDLVSATYRSTSEAFETELVEFHRLVTEGTSPLSGVAEGRADIITSQRIMRRLAQQQGITIGGEAATA